jgi:type VI secretion system protein ImpG
VDERLLRLYRDELAYLREVGAEFAHDHPKIAARLGMEGMEVADPYVERLIEGFAFLAARIQLKLEAEQPRLIAHLLESTYPNFLAPVPSMMVARLVVDSSDPNLAKGHPVERGSAIVAETARGKDTRCEYRSAHAMTLWPVEVTSARYFAYAPDLPLARLAAAQGMRGGLRIKLRCGGGLTFAQLRMQELVFFISAAEDVAYRLHELVLGAALGSWVSAEPGAAAEQWRPAAQSIAAVGLDNPHALLPETPRGFSGHRLLQELAALPQRALFFAVTDLGPRLARVASDEAELVILFSRADAALEPLVDRNSVALHCTPAVNLFHKRLDRIALGAESWEYHAVPDRTRPMDFEVHSIESVVGHGTGREKQREFLPLYAMQHGRLYDEQSYYTVRREPRRRSERQQLQGTRSAYLGDEVYLSLVDAGHGAYREELRQLSVAAWVTNRDLPALLPIAGGWRLEAAGPASRVEALVNPTPPVSRRPHGDIGWRLVSQLALNHLSLTGATPEQAAAALRNTLTLYGPPEGAAWARQVDGVHALAARPTVRRLPFEGPLTFGAGVEIVLELDELAYQGVSAFLMASVLERFFARHAAINSFTQLTLRTLQRGVVASWPPRIGAKETV